MLKPCEGSDDIKMPQGVEHDESCGVAMRGLDSDPSDPAEYAKADPLAQATAPSSENELRPPLLPVESSHRSLRERTVGELTVDGMRHSCLTLTSTALGGGLLSISYVLEQVGLVLGVMMLVIGALVAYLSTVALMRISHASRESSYAGLFSHCAGRRAGPILDAMLFIYGNGSCVGYFVFLGDFIPALVQLAVPHGPAWCHSRWLAIGGAALLMLPLVLQKDLAALRHLTPVSIMSLMYVAIVIFSRCDYYYEKHKGLDEYGDIIYFNPNLGLFNAFSICIFAFNCHLNVVPVAGRLIRPTKQRIRKVAWWVNGLQLSFYCLIGVSGYLTFEKKTPQDIIHGFKDSDPYMVVGRVLLTITMVTAIPINLIPTVRSALQIRDFFHPDDPILEPSPQPSPLSSPGASPRLDSPNSPPAQSQSSEPALPRIALTLFCLALQVAVAIAVPGVADVISILGATVATAMMMVIPAYAIGKVLSPSLGNRIQQVVLLTFACVSFASVPVKLLNSLGVVHVPG
jgi:amino acid permease